MSRNLDLADEELGPLLIAPRSYLEVRARIRKALGFPKKRLPLIIGIDGEDGSGKSSLAAWMSWQFEMPALHLDVYLKKDEIDWDFDTLERTIVGAQSEPKTRPVIVEGIYLLDVLCRVNRAPDFHVFVEKENHHGNMQKKLKSYIERARAKSTYILKWSSKDHDERVMNAHLARQD